VTRIPGCLPTIIPDTDAIGLVQVSDENGNVSWQPLTSTTDIAPTGLTGATAASRYVGATTSGAPLTGTFAVGDFVVDRTGSFWICTTAGTPGTWSSVAVTPIDGTDNPLAIGTAAPGSTGKASDAGHVHAWGQAAPAGFTPADPLGTASTTLVMMGLGAACAYTTAGSGVVLVNVTGTATTATAVQTVTIGGRYGTGTAPANGDAVTGTRFGGAADGTVQPPTAGAYTAFALTAILTLVPSTPSWFDIAISTGNAADSASISNVSMTFAELP
jgi:hypothetical protein